MENVSSEHSDSWLVQPLLELMAYCRQRQWAGHDPYDGLNSRVFANTPLMKSRYFRLALIQGLKRLPLDLRSVLQVPREQNPKGIALFVSTLLRLQQLGLAEIEEAKTLVRRLIELRTTGQNQTCWGYNFDWQTRYYLVPRYTPNIICTTFAGNAVLDAYDALGDTEYLEHANSAARFLLASLNRTNGKRGFCFSYTPLDRSVIHNANLLGSAFLARVHRHTQNAELRSIALDSARFSVDYQRADGSWPYGEGNKQGWNDSFHTGYNLCALEKLRNCFPDQEWIAQSVNKGFGFFMEHFFTPEGMVKYYHDRLHPIDVHAIAQAVVTLVELRDYSARSLPLIRQILDWAFRNMRRDDAAFYFQRHARYTNRIAYMRWGQAWMLLAMTYALMAFKSKGTGLPADEKRVSEPAVSGN